MSVLEGKNHIIQKDDAAWPTFSKILVEFTSTGSTTGFDDLTKREQDVLRLICQAMSSKEIAKGLNMSEERFETTQAKSMPNWNCKTGCMWLFSNFAAAN